MNVSGPVGQGEIVVVHPSLGRPSSDFDELTARLLRGGVTVLAVEPRGIGGRDPLAGDADLHDLAADLLEVLDDAGVTAAHLVGHALGNRVVRCVATDQPDRVRSVTLLAAGGSAEGDQEARSALLACFDEQLAEAERLQAIRTAFFAPGNDVAGTWRTGWHTAAAIAQGAAVRRTQTEDWWSAGHVRMLVVQGLQDRIAPPANGRQLRAERPDTTLVEIDQAGHALLPEQPEAIAEAVLSLVLQV